MLERLRCLHETVLRGIDALDAQVASSHPDIAAVSAARLALSKASRARNCFLENTVYPAVEPLDRAVIDGLRSRGRERAMMSSEHVHRWTVAEVSRCWSEYRAVSTEIRHGMRARIREEQTLLYPLIEVAMRAAA